MNELIVGDGGACKQAAQTGTVFAGGVRLLGPHAIGADAWSGRPRRGTRIFSSTGSNGGESPRRLAATAIAMGFDPARP
ncbi:hypothetical protein ACIF6K_18955 [Streptomyces sp. NPDC085942]|uniref:hypothetical protein n=1 Tax=Streptomyces sp. NPDC085942 TaxID=3365743 RepID=UPI0037D37217